MIQHSPKIEQYLEQIKGAAEQKELPFHLYAMMEDCFLMHQGKEQIYGTQATTRTLKSGKTENFIWPIKDPPGVNKLRKEAGFGQTVEENATRLNVKYRVVKLAEIWGMNSESCYQKNNATLTIFSEKGSFYEN